MIEKKMKIIKKMRQKEEIYIAKLLSEYLEFFKNNFLLQILK